MRRATKIEFIENMLQLDAPDEELGEGVRSILPELLNLVKVIDECDSFGYAIPYKIIVAREKLEETV